VNTFGNAVDRQEKRPTRGTAISDTVSFVDTPEYPERLAPGITERQKTGHRRGKWGQRGQMRLKNEDRMGIETASVFGCSAENPM